MEEYSENLKPALVLIDWHLPNCDWQGENEGNNGLISYPPLFSRQDESEEAHEKVTIKL